MLEKEPENTDVVKLRTKLLLEVDFNTIYKTIFNGRLTPTLEAVEVIPHEIIRGRRTQPATDLTLNNNLISDIANVCKLPTTIIYADTANYYNRVA